MYCPHIPKSLPYTLCITQKQASNEWPPWLLEYKYMHIVAYSKIICSVAMAEHFFNRYSS